MRPMFLHPNTDAERRAARELLLPVCHEFGFANASIGIYSRSNSMTYAATTLPDDWVDLYRGNQLQNHDPRWHTAPLANRPIDRKVLEHFDKTGFLDLFESKGLGNQGICIPLRAAHEAVSVLSLNRNCDDDAWQRHIDACLQSVQATAVRLQQDFIDLWDLERVIRVEELEVMQIRILQAIAEGHNVKEAAEFLGISLRRIENQLSITRTKLRCRTTYHAIAKAATMGIIAPV